MAAEKIGRITQVIGAVLDIRFQAGELPLINEAIRIKREDGGELVAEVSQHLGRRYGKMYCHGFDRRSAQRNGSNRNRRCDQCSGGRKYSGTHVQRTGSAD